MATITSMLLIGILAILPPFRLFFAYSTAPIRYPIGFIISIPTIIGMGLVILVEPELCMQMANMGSKTPRVRSFVRVRAAIWIIAALPVMVGLSAVYFVTPALGSKILEKFRYHMNGF